MAHIRMKRYRFKKYICKKGQLNISSVVSRGSGRFDSGTYVHYNSDNIEIRGSIYKNNPESNYNDYGLVTDNKINITRYKKLKMQYIQMSGTDYLSRNGFVAISQYKDNWSASRTWTKQIYGNLPLSEKIIELDISDMIGEYYIIFAAGAGNNSQAEKLQIKNVWLE